MAEPSFLVVNVSRIGDTLLATPAIRAIADAHRGARIVALGHPKRAEIFQHLAFIERTGTITKRTALWRGRLPGRRYDYALVYGFDESLVAYGLRAAKRVVAFRQKNESLNRRLYRAVDAPAFQSEHSVLQHLRLTAAIGIPPAGLRLAYHVTAPERAYARALLNAEVPAAARPLVGLQVASFHTKSHRDWPIEHFAELAKRLAAEQRRAHFLIYGGAEERERTEWLKNQLGARATSYAGRLRLRQTAAVMSLTDLYIGVDTGPTHIVSAMDVPMVVMYHCTAPSRLIGPLEHPCFHPVDHPRPFRCPVETPMAEIQVDTVLLAVRRALAQPSSAAGSQ